MLLEMLEMLDMLEKDFSSKVYISTEPPVKIVWVSRTTRENQSKLNHAFLRKKLEKIELNLFPFLSIFNEFYLKSPKIIFSYIKTNIFPYHQTP